MSSIKSQYGNFFKFKKDDIFYNTLKTHPRVEFFIYSGSVYFNNENQTGQLPRTPTGSQNLYELNVDRVDSQLIYPFVSKQGSFHSFKTVSTAKFNQDFTYGDIVSGSYPLTASISVDRYDTSLSDSKKKVLYALKNTLNYYTKLSPEYAYSSSARDLESEKINLISVPSIFYGSSIDKGSVRLKFYVTGTLLAEVADTKKNGELIQTSGSTTGGVVGTVLYNEGFIMLTSSAALSNHGEVYDSLNTDGSTPSPVSASWYTFGVTGSATNSTGSSFSIDFNGVQRVNTITMFAEADKNQLNFSNNPTFLSTGSMPYKTGSGVYAEKDDVPIKNITSSSYRGYTSSFEPVTYISKIALYDKDKNLIGIASLANPVRKREKDGYTFKLKLDI